MGMLNKSTKHSRKDFYGSLMDVEENVIAFNEPRLSPMYSRLVEDCRADLPRSLLDVDYKRFWDLYTKVSQTIAESLKANLRSKNL